MTESIPDALAEDVWAWRELGESCDEISRRLRQIGYNVRADEVAVIASRCQQQHDAEAATPT